MKKSKLKIGIIVGIIIIIFLVLFTLRFVIMSPFKLLANSNIFKKANTLETDVFYNVKTGEISENNITYENFDVSFLNCFIEEKEYYDNENLVLNKNLNLDFGFNKNGVGVQTAFADTLLYDSSNLYASIGFPYSYFNQKWYGKEFENLNLNSYYTALGRWNGHEIRICLFGLDDSKLHPNKLTAILYNIKYVEVGNADEQYIKDTKFKFNINFINE